MTIERRSLNVLRSYLASMSNMSSESNKKVFGLIEKHYQERMKDECYSHAVKSFVERSPEIDEINEFYFILVRQIILQENLREELKEMM